MFPTASMPLLIKFPSRSRPQLFASTFARWNAEPSAVRFIVSLDHDDAALPAYRDFLAGQPNAQVFVGHSECKVHAINRDMEHAGEYDAVAIAADDMLPQRTDYAAEIVRLMAEHFPDTYGVLHLNDGRVGRRCNTMPVLGREWVRQHGIFHSAYRAVYCDEELTEVANRANRSHYVDEVLIRHAWPAGGEMDALSKRNEDRALYAADCETFKQRQAWGFPPADRSTTLSGLAGS